MFVECSKILGLAIAAEDAQAKVGSVKDLVIDPDNGNLLGFVVKSGFLSPSKILSSQDIVDWDQNGIITSSTDNLVEAKEIVRINNILEKKIFLIGMNAKTESGKGLGKIEDLLIDTNNLCVVKYYLADYLGDKRVFSADKVIKIEKNIIIFSDDTTEIPAGASEVVNPA